MAFSHIQPSFGTGELSPSLFARVDLAKYASGAALMRNFFTDYRGGASNRAGTQFIRAVDGSAGAPRVIPFTVSTLATYMLVFGNDYIQFFSNGAYVVGADVVSPYAAADLPLLKYVQSADVLTLTHPLYPVYNLTRTAPTTFSLDQDVIGPVIDPPTALTSTPTITSNDNAVYSYVVTAVSSVNGSEESIASVRVDQESPWIIPSGSLNPVPSIKLTWTAPVQPVAYYKVYKANPSNSITNPAPSAVNTVFGFIGQSVTASFFDGDIVPDFSQAPPQFQDPFSPGQIASVSVLTGGSGYGTPYTVDLIFTGGGGTGAAGYAVTDDSTGTVVGVVITDFGKGYTTAPVVTDGGDATYSCTIGQLFGTYPACVTYFQQRRVFGGTLNFPESFVCSQPGLYNNFDTTPISLASDSITASIASRQDNSIKSMVAMPTGLIIFTTGGGFLVSGGNSQAAISPSDIVAFPQASSGANDLPPLVVNYDVLYCQNRGAVVRDLAFNFYVQSYTGTDRSVLASHLFLGHTLLDWTYAEEPFRQILVVRDDGILLAFTYVPEQEVFAWTHYDTNGLFVSIASVPEGQENAVYVIVQRLVGGVYVYYLERFASRIFTQVEDAWFLDCALQLPETSPAAGITLSAATGNITVTASAAVFSAPQVGDTLWAGGGKATITGFTSTTILTATVLIPFPTFMDDPFLTPLPYASGEWTLDTPVTTVTGLDHLNGLYVSALADGVPVPATIISGGSLTLPQPATKVIAGLAYQSQLQTLRLDTGEPTIQGKRKNIAALTIRTVNSLGLKAGPTFDPFDLTEIKDLQIPYTPPIRMYTGDSRVIIQSVWQTEGQLAFQQDPPLPVTILGIIPEIVVGDTQR